MQSILVDIYVASSYRPVNCGVSVRDMSVNMFQAHLKNTVQLISLGVAFLHTKQM